MANIFRQIRKEQGLTVYGIAKELGISGERARHLDSSCKRIDNTLHYSLWKLSGYPAKKYLELLGK